MECAYYFGERHMECAYYFGGRHMECAYYFGRNPKLSIKKGPILRLTLFLLIASARKAKDR